MPLILTADTLGGYTGQRAHYIYNALDCVMTARGAEVLLPSIAADPLTARHYALQHVEHVPALVMGLRGIKISETARAEAIVAQEAAEREAIASAQALAAPWWDERAHVSTPCAVGARHKWPREPDLAKKACALCGQPWLSRAEINPHSDDQVKRLLYARMGLPEQHEHKEHKVSVAKECLDKLLEHRACAHAVPLIQAILAARVARKQLGTLRTRIDSDGRWRASQHVSMDVTGRWSSSGGPFWTGANIQNIADRSRGMFVADPGLVLFYADYEKAESHVVAYDAGDENYIAAHAAGDVHTMVARLVWPEIGQWSRGEEPTNCGAEHHAKDGSCCDRGLADLPTAWNPHLTYRDFAKHIAHGSAIGMTHFGIARDAHITQADALAAQTAYFGAFRRVRDRQGEIWRQVQQTGMLTNPLGRRRRFMGRLFGEDADATRREALAQMQQSTIADWVGVAICRLWSELDGHIVPWQAPQPTDPNRIWLLAQVHDAVLGLVRWGDDATLARVKELMLMALTLHGRQMVIPVEIKIGPSWAKRDMRLWQPGMDWPREWR